MHARTVVNHSTCSVSPHKSGVNWLRHKTPARNAGGKAASAAILQSRMLCAVRPVFQEMYAALL